MPQTPDPGVSGSRLLRRGTTLKNMPPLAAACRRCATRQGDRPFAMVPRGAAAPFGVPASGPRGQGNGAALCRHISPALGAHLTRAVVSHAGERVHAAAKVSSAPINGGFNTQPNGGASVSARWDSVEPCALYGSTHLTRIQRSVDAWPARSSLRIEHEGNA